MWATVQDVRDVIGSAGAQESTPKGGDFDSIMAIHLATASSLITARLTEGGWTVPIAGLTATASSFLRAAQVAIALERAQLARGGAVDSDTQSNVERDARVYRDALARIAGGGPLADMRTSVQLFEAIVPDPGFVSPYDLTSAYGGGRCPTQ